MVLTTCLHAWLHLSRLIDPACLAVQFLLQQPATETGLFGLVSRWSHTVLETFSLLAVGTSLIGTLLGASQFFIEQMTNSISIASSPGQQHVRMVLLHYFKNKRLMKWCQGYNPSVECCSEFLTKQAASAGQEEQRRC